MGCGASTASQVAPTTTSSTPRKQRREDRPSSAKRQQQHHPERESETTSPSPQTPYRQEKPAAAEVRSSQDESLPPQLQKSRDAVELQPESTQPKPAVRDSKRYGNEQPTKESAPRRSLEKPAQSNPHEANTQTTPADAPSTDKSESRKADGKPSQPPETTSKAPAPIEAEPGVEILLKPLPPKKRLEDITSSPNTVRSGGLSAVRGPPTRNNSAKQSTLPALTRAPPVAFEIDFGVAAPTRKNPIQERLEREAAEKAIEKMEENERPSTAALVVERKLEQAAERREKYQEEISNKAKIRAQERKVKVKELEKQKAEQLKKLMSDKRRLAEQNKVLKEKEMKKRLTSEARHAARVLAKAEKFKSSNPDAYEAAAAEQHQFKSQSVSDQDTPITPSAIVPETSSLGTPSSPRSIASTSETSSRTSSSSVLGDTDTTSTPKRPESASTRAHAPSPLSRQGSSSALPSLSAKRKTPRSHRADDGDGDITDKMNRDSPRASPRENKAAEPQAQGHSTPLTNEPINNQKTFIYRMGQTATLTTTESSHAMDVRELGWTIPRPHRTVLAPGPSCCSISKEEKHIPQHLSAQPFTPKGLFSRCQRSRTTQKRTTHTKEKSITMGCVASTEIPSSPNTGSPKKSPTSSLSGLRSKDVQLLRIVAEGKHSVGYLGLYLKSSEQLLKRYNADSKMCYEKECKIYKRILQPHPNIVQCIGTWTSQRGDKHLVLEYVSKGSLLPMLKVEGSSTSPEEKIRWCYEISQAMEFLADRRVAYRCLRTSKIVMQEIAAKRYSPKISNFRRAVELDSSGKYKDTTADESMLRWNAPEVLNGGIYSTKSDVWAFGVVMWDIFTNGRALPFHTFPNDEVAERLAGGPSRSSHIQTDFDRNLWLVVFIIITVRGSSPFYRRYRVVQALSVGMEGV
ncbi:tyrosine-protein kinase ITK/TSK-like [Planoprotostelium fungivorum]|uniref:Tyrosine-protein kinase ITK/TSK-like n=1 Tax=Planoprotostelium fungivorum TaxID=1890364 RepID=A0A2P6NMK7_9EUKA|nr:tyrosine-protein kinase ITK/TSK-like [Planoprotostelium fungivorum]